MLHMDYGHGGDVFGAARKLKCPPQEIIDFSANINPLGVSPQIILAIQEHIGLIQHYPDPRCLELRNKLSGFLNVPAENMVFGNGAAELIYLLARVMGYRRALVCAPTFSEYGAAITCNQGTVKEIRLAENDGFALPVAAVKKAVGEVEAVFLCNPNNPTGRLEKKNNIQSIIEAAQEKNVAVIVDEAFIDFVADRDHYSVMPLLKDYPNLVVLYSMTKFFAMPGLRLGVLLGDVSIIKKIEQAKEPWNVNSLAQIAGAVGLGDKDYMEKTKQLVGREKDFLHRSISRLPGYRVFPGDANYLLVKITDDSISSSKLASITASYGVLVRDCANFSGLDHSFIRVAVRTRAENVKLLEILETAMKGA